MDYVLGVDFGTTNTALCARFADGTSRSVRFGPDEVEPCCRSALFFLEADEPGAAPHHTAGDDALRDCLASQGEGRFIQSLKSFLASRVFGATQIYSRKYTLEDLVGFFLRFIRARAEHAFGGAPQRTTVGVPVRFAYANDDDDDAFARGRLAAAFAAAGFGEVRFELEPVAAAYAWLLRAERKSQVLVADFGGGTSDFAVVQFGGAAGRAHVLATSGVAVAGDNLDAKIVRHLVAPSLGRGSTYVGFDGARKEIPPTLFHKLERWHHLSFMNNDKTLRQLRQLEREADEPEKITALIDVIENNLGFQLHDAVRRAKQALSEAEETTFSFSPWPELALQSPLTRAEFEGWVEPELEAIAGALDEVLAKAGVDAGAVEAVFMTGGTSFVPAVRALLRDRLGERSLEAGEELASISTGLAQVAALG